MRSEQRLHPASVLFSLAQSVKAFALPGLLLLISAGRSSGGADGRFGRLPVNWELWLMLLLIPSAILAVVRYFSFRIRYDGTELVIRSGLVFRSERHVPYARIQNLDAIQNVFHRALGVVEVRVETGGGREPEARISVLPAAAFEEMRRRVFAGRAVGPLLDALPADVAGVAVLGRADAPVPPATRTLLHLPLRDLLLFGVIENRGFIVIGAAYGIAWELGLFDRLIGPMFSDGSYIREVVRSGAVGALARGADALRAVAVLAGGVAALLIVVRIISMLWAAVRLHGFQLTRTGSDLHTRFGLFTRVATTIPLPRIQALTITEGLLSRMLGRVSVQVETAGSHEPASGGRKAEREWLAPMLRRGELAGLAREVMPELDLEALAWQPPHPRAARREAVPRLVVAAALCLLLAPASGAGAAALLPIAVGWALLSARKHVQHMGWASTADVIAFRSGWLRRSVTVVRVTRIQAVRRAESPLDRRAAMARVGVDTAGRTDRSHRVDIPYLARDTADHLHRRLALQAARTVFSTR